MVDNKSGSLDQFSKLIRPFEAAEFTQNYYEQRPLYIGRDDKTYFAHLLNSVDIDRLFERTAIAKSTVRIVKDGKDLHSDQFAQRDGDVPIDRLSNNQVLKLFAGGHTIVINSGDRLFPRLDRYCNELERELGFRVQPNIYITPFSAQGFATHYDDHDVFILQVMGSKNWRVFHSPVELPSRRQPHSRMKGTYTLGAPQMQVTLSPGDSLYIPRGFLHDADTDGTTSAHVTLGLHPTYRFDLVQELALLAQDTPAFRTSIPIGLVRDRAAACVEFGRLLRDLIDRLDVDALLERRSSSFVDQRRQDFRARFSELAQMNGLGLNTIVRRRPGVLCTIERSRHTLTILFAGNTVPLQPFLESALDSILGDAPFAVRDINAFLSDKGRLELAGTLLKHGLLEVVDWKRAE